MMVISNSTFERGVWRLTLIIDILFYLFWLLWSDAAHSQILILGFLNALRLERGVVRLTLFNKIDGVRFNCGEVRCVVAHFQMIF